MRRFIDEHRQTFGVESICKAFQIAPSGYWKHAACQRNPDLRSARAIRPLIGTAQRVFSCPGPGEVFGCYKTESSLQSLGWHAGWSQTDGGARTAL